MAFSVLTQRDVDQFLETGWCKVEDCFSAEDAACLRARWIQEQALDPDRPLHEQFDMRHRGLAEALNARDFAPKAFAAAGDLVGATRMREWWWNNFIVNAGRDADKPWKLPALDEGWHVDGIWFHHFLDSQEQALLTIELYSDVESQGGATLICEGSYPYYARALAEYPAGIDPQEAVRLAQSVVPFERLHKREVLGKAGTVYFCHPFMLHASSPNTLRVPRFVTNATVTLDEPMQFADLSRASVVERSIIEALGGPFEFVATGQRRRYQPEEYSSFNHALPAPQRSSEPRAHR